MIYGLNFNRTHIPAEMKKKFAREVTVAPRVRAVLAGVEESKEECDIMLRVATNGHRRLHVEEWKVAGGKKLFGIYVY
jgi:hypothetical protein